MLLIIVSVVSGCSKTNKEKFVAKSQESIQLREAFTNKLMFRWRGLLPDTTENSCFSAGPCGTCSGLCIYWDPIIATSELSKQEIADGIGIGTINLIQNDTKLSMICSTTPDNGNGYTQILRNWSWPEEIADVFGYDSLVIKAGTYAVNYNNYPNGRVDFNVEVY